MALSQFWKGGQQLAKTKSLLSLRQPAEDFYEGRTNTTSPPREPILLPHRPPALRLRLLHPPQHPADADYSLASGDLGDSHPIESPRRSPHVSLP